MEFFIIFSREDFASCSSFSFLLCSYNIPLFFLLVVPLPLLSLTTDEIWTESFQCGLDNSGTLYLVLDWIFADLHTSSIVSFSSLSRCDMFSRLFCGLVWCFMVLFFMIFQAVFWWAPLSIWEGKSSSLNIYFSSCRCELSSLCCETETVFLFLVFGMINFSCSSSPRLLLQFVNIYAILEPSKFGFFYEHLVAHNFHVIYILQSFILYTAFLDANKEEIFVSLAVIIIQSRCVKSLFMTTLVYLWRTSSSTSYL